MLQEENNKTKLFESVIVGLIIILSGCYINVIGVKTNYIAFLSIAILGIYYIFNNKKNTSIQFCYLIAFSIVFLFTFIYNSDADTIKNYIDGIYVIILSYIIINIVSWNNFKKYYVNLMFILTIISIICYYFLSDFIIQYGIRFNHKSNSESVYYSFIFYSYSPIINRNSGFFWEPGLFATAIIYAIILINQSKITKKIIFYNVIFIIGIISTQSSAGYMLMFITYIYILSSKINNHSTYYLWQVLAIILLGIGLIIAYIYLDKIILAFNLQDDFIYNKMMKENFLNNPRIIAVKENIECFKNNFVFGLGSKKSIDLMGTLDSYDTATMFVMLSKYGIGGFVYWIMIAHSIMRVKNINVLSKVFLMILLVLMVNKEPNMTYLFSWVLMFYMLGSPSFNESNQVEVIKENI